MSARASLRHHWPEYLIEVALIGIFMVSACTFGTLVFYGASPLAHAIATPIVRRLLMGSAMGLTAIALIYSHWGLRSGAHMNPATTITFLRLGRVKSWDAAFYIAAQITGGILGVLVAALLLGSARLGDPAVNYVVTRPGIYGTAAAFMGEAFITFLLMMVVLTTAASRSLSRYTGVFVGILVASFIIFEDPLSGMSMNPARTLGSAVAAHQWTALWIYFAGPLVGMLSAGELFVRLHGRERAPCAKLRHVNHVRCIFCGHNPTSTTTAAQSGTIPQLTSF